MPTIGEVLSDARRRRGLSLEQAEESTKIRKKYLIALEEDDYAALPVPVYARGFLRNYAEYLGIESGLIQQMVEPAAKAAARIEVRPAGSMYKNRSSGHFLQYLLVLVAALVGIGGLVFVYSQYASFDRNSGDNVAVRPPASAVPTPSLAAVAPVATPSPSPTPSPSATPVRSVEVEIRLLERTWVRVVADGAITPTFEGELAAGEVRTWKARDRIDMRVGNAGGVEVTVNGMRQGKLGASGEVKTVTWGRQ